MSRYPIITQQAEAGGEPCPPDVIDKIAETRKCDERMCPGKTDTTFIPTALTYVAL